MKIKSIYLKNYKKFTKGRKLEFDDFCTLIIANNGVGKTSVLQAIAAITASATAEIDHPSQLDWSGFVYSFLSSGGVIPTVKCNYSFTDEELNATKDLYIKVNRAGNLKTIPGNDVEVEVSLDYNNEKVKTSTANQLFQFRGNAYAKSLKAENISFNKVGGVYWYTEERNTKSFKGYFNQFENAYDNIRYFLSQRELFHQKILGGMSMKDGEIDIYKKLSDSYSAIFTTRKFIGSRPRNGNGAYLPPYFYITDGENEYEIAEMSAGERAIFPLLVDFSNLTINNSIVLIDEIELHLHPPLQQSFLNALSKLGENNQFIITTHSDYIATMIPAENKIYL